MGTAQLVGTPRANVSAGNAYDPRYDPLVASNPGAGLAHAPSYWVASAGPEPETDGPIHKDIDVDIAIIGSGATGIATALFLAREHGIAATVIEANQIA
jgi:FAD dependent oxidoreductase